MRRLVVVLLFLAACNGGGSVAATTTSSASTTTSGGKAAASSTTQPPTECPPAPYELTFVPEGIGSGELHSETIEQDVWTSVAGTNTTFVPRTDDTVAIALIRGTLPPVDWPAEKGEISIDGTRAAVGPHPDGTWVAGWYEEPAERCDLYTMVFYPPWNPNDVQSVLLGMNRVGG